MKGKVNCTCGWSWNKSDSSKKDMYICHQCGRDNSNNMKNGGWLNSYQNGGDTDNEDYNMKRALELGYTPDDTGHWPSVDDETGEWLKSKKHHTRGMEMMAYELNPELRNKYNLIENEKGVLQYVDKKDFKNGGWLDNYGTQANYNDSKATASPDMVGEGFSNVGRNYSPAWGGQFQKGGKLKFLQPTSDRLPEGYRIPYDTPSTERATSIGGVDGEPAYLVPEFKYGEPLYDPIEEFKRTGEHLGGPFKTWQEADEWEKTVRHPAVENRETIMFPQEKFQTGGSIPGAVGFTYARTKGIPSEGPYAKKTLPSAQNGQEMQYYQNGLDFKPKSISRDGAWLNKYEQAQTGKTFKLKDERENAYTVKDNIQPLSLKQKKANELLIKETEKAKKDKQELTTTGQIKNPRSIRYKKLAPKQSDLKTQTKSNEELEGQLGLERPLIYLASPEKLLGDLGVPGMETSELDRQAVMANRFNPNQSRLDRFVNNANIGLGYVPDATVNTAMAAAFMPEGSGALGLVNEVLNPLAGLKMSVAPELRQGLKTAGPSFASSANNVTNISKNLEDLNYAKKWAKQYGYELPKNLERIAQSDELTNRTVRGMMNRHNTFVRGISTNWEEIGKRNPQVLQHLEDIGIDYINNPKAAAEYMATHIPGDTGYGRFGLKPGENAIYLSNSKPTAEGYTYGQGYTVKVKKPTDFSSENRQDWLINNDFDAHLGFKGSPFGEGIVKNDYIKRFPVGLRETLAATGDPNKMVELQKAVKEKEALYNELAHASWKKHNNLISDLKYKTDANYRKYQISDDPFVRDTPNVFDQMHLNLLNTKKNLTQSYYNALPLVDIAKGVYGDPDVWKAIGKNMFGKIDPFSHYAIKGQPGEKVLEAINFKEIKPELWNNTSRGHINLSSKGLTRRKDGGIIKDDRGQWEHPGEITEISSNQITMEGVPYDVLGISDTGDTKLMKPGKNYKFKGKKVTEYPMAKNGINNLDARPLVKLDQLTNFTNYNKPQPGSGWLSKYN
jgi:hypothetical protein